MTFDCNGNSTVLIIFLVVFVGFIALSFAVAGIKKARISRLKNDDNLVDGVGTVTKCSLASRTEVLGKLTINYKVTVQLHGGGETTSIVKQRFYQEGEVVNVKYRPDKPNLCLIGETVTPAPQEHMPADSLDPAAIQETRPAQQAAPPAVQSLYKPPPENAPEGSAAYYGSGQPAESLDPETIEVYDKLTINK